MTTFACLPLRRPSLRAVLLALACGTVIPSPTSLAQDSGTTPDAATPDDWEKRSEQHFEEVAAGGSIRVINPYGNVYGRFGGYERRTEILTTTQRIDRQYPALEMVRRHDDDGLTIEVRPKGEVPAGIDRRQWRDRIDVVVFVPEDIPLTVETSVDDVELKGLHSDVSVKTVTGNVNIRKIKGSVDVESDRGRLIVTLATGVTKNAQSFSTVTGDIDVYVWEDADVTFDLATSGEIATDFSIDIDHKRFEEPDKYATAVVNDGNGKVTLRSKRGRLKLGRLPRDYRQVDGASTK